jgi:acetoin utilization deacetylase AcuC-like enzyme
MAASRVTAVVEDSHFLDHRGPAGHPERPERLTAVHAALAPRRDRLDALAPRPATREEILRIHSPDHVDRISRACETAPAHLDPDTYVSPESFDVGLLAAGGTVDLARAIAAGRVQAGLASVRPPGHHAEADRAMGFCLFNNIAVAARALQAEDGFDRVLILDWDVHHGNGTQHSFEEDPAVLYVSTHQYRAAARASPSTSRCPRAAATPSTSARSNGSWSRRRAPSGPTSSWSHAVSTPTGTIPSPACR